MGNRKHKKRKQTNNNKTPEFLACYREKEIDDMTSHFMEKMIYIKNVINLVKKGKFWPTIMLSFCIANNKLKTKFVTRPKKLHLGEDGRVELTYIPSKSLTSPLTEGEFGHLWPPMAAESTERSNPLNESPEFS